MDLFLSVTGLKLSRSGVALQLVQNSCPELDTCFSRAELHLKSLEAGLVLQNATPVLDLRN